MNTTRLAVLLIAGAALSACGGGDDAEPTPPPPVQASNQVPAIAYASTLAYSSFAASLASTESGEPLLLGSTPAPSSETEEPVPVMK